MVQRKIMKSHRTLKISLLSNENGDEDVVVCWTSITDLPKDQWSNDGENINSLKLAQSIIDVALSLIHFYGKDEEFIGSKSEEAEGDGEVG